MTMGQGILSAALTSVYGDWLAYTENRRLHRVSPLKTV